MRLCRSRSLCPGTALATSAKQARLSANKGPGALTTAAHPLQRSDHPETGRCDPESQSERHFKGDQGWPLGVHRQRAPAAASARLGATLCAKDKTAD